MKQQEYIPVSEWGKDHWSTLAYAETRAVDAFNNGVLDNRRMRTNPRLHRELVGVMHGEIQDGSKYSTRLKDRKLPDHDDWSCLEDAVHAGFIKISTKKVNENAFGCAEAKVKFTELGYSVVAKLRKHKAEGGNFSNFNLEELQ